MSRTARAGSTRASRGRDGAIPRRRVSPRRRWRRGKPHAAGATRSTSPASDVAGWITVDAVAPWLTRPTIPDARTTRRPRHARGIPAWLEEPSNHLPPGSSIEDAVAVTSALLQRNPSDAAYMSFSQACGKWAGPNPPMGGWASPLEPARRGLTRCFTITSGAQLRDSCRVASPSAAASSSVQMRGAAATDDELHTICGEFCISSRFELPRAIDL